MFVEKFNMVLQSTALRADAMQSNDAGTKFVRNSY